MPSVWVETRNTPKGERYRVVWREVIFDVQGRPGKGPRRKLPQVSDPVRADKQKLAKISELEDIEAGLKPKARLRVWGDVAELYLSHAKMRIPKSYPHLVKPAVDQFTAFVGAGCMADNIDSTTFIAYEKHLRGLEPKNKPGELYKGNTVRRLLKDLRTCLRFAHKHGWMRELPRLSLPPAQDSERLPSRDELSQLQDVLEPQYRTPFRLAACTGLRLNELLKADGKDFRWNGDEGYWEIKVRILKRKEDDPTKVKVVPIQPFLASDIGLPRPPGMIFKIKPNAMEKAVSRACQKVGITDPITPHDLRHYWATHLMEETGDLYGLMRLGGWKDIKSVLKYQHLTRGRSKAILGIDFIPTGPGEPPQDDASPSKLESLRS